MKDARIKKSYRHAMYALAYIVGVVMVMVYAVPPEDNVLSGIMALSLFVLSVAAMAYFFFSQPVALYLDGKKKEGVRSFLETAFFFGGMVAVVIVVSQLLAAFSSL